MRCPCCYEEYDGNICPLCGFEDFQIVGDYSEGMKQLKPLILANRKKFLGDYLIGICLTKRQDSDLSKNKTVSEKLYFGKVKDLSNNDKWLNLSIVSYPDLDNKTKLDVVISNKSDERIERTSISGMDTAGIIDIGITLCDSNTFCVKIKKDNTIVGVSEPIQIRRGLSNVE